MKYKSRWSAKVLILFCLALGTTSWFYGKSLSENQIGLKLTLEKSIGKEKAFKQAYADMAHVLASDNRTIAMDESFSELLLSVMHNRAENGVIITTVTPHKTMGTAGAAETSKLKENVPGTTAGSIRIDIRGTYSNYLGLQNYIHSLKALPVSVVYLKVDNKAFELALRVYGN